MKTEHLVKNTEEQRSNMYYVIAKRQASYGDELVEEDFDFDHPIATYEENDLRLASQHAHTHTMNHGVSTIVVREEDMETVKRNLPSVDEAIHADAMAYISQPPTDDEFGDENRELNWKDIN